MVLFKKGTMQKILILLLFGCHVALFAGRQDIRIPREDGSAIIGYFDRPDEEGDVPVVVFIDGSWGTSVAPHHEKLAARFNPRQIGILSLEKRGITPDGIDAEEFAAHDCRLERLSDYRLLLCAIERGEVKGCTGRVVVLGASEGGKMAPGLSLSFPSIVQGVVLIGAGGGLSFAEEVKFQIAALIEEMPVWKRASYKLRRSLFPNEVDEAFAQILAHPESLEKYGSKTWKWFASYFSYDPLPDLLKIAVPIYMIHGEKDIMVPVQSADLVKEAFDSAGKLNLHYARYQDLGHALTGREDVYGDLLEWVVKVSFSDKQEAL